MKLTTVLTISSLLLLLPVSPALTQPGRALRVPNSGQTTAYVRIADSPDLEPAQFTLEAWITPLGVGSGPSDQFGAVIVEKPREGASGPFLQTWGLRWSQSTRKIVGQVSNNIGVSGQRVFSNARVNIGTTAHIALTFDGSSLVLIIDGQLDSTVATTFSDLAYGDEDVLLGAGNFASSFLRRFDGIIDEVRIWDHVRNSATISSQMHSQLSGVESGLLAYYTFDNDDLTDSAPNQNHGVAEGAPTFVDGQLAEAVRAGTVDRSSGAPTDVLKINGSAGDSDRVVALATGESIKVAFEEPPAGSNNGRYILWVWGGEPFVPFSITAAGSNIGCVVSATPLQFGQNPQPFRCVRGAGIPSIGCNGVVELSGPSQVPFCITKSQGLSSSATFTLQGLVEDDGAANGLNFSVTNCVILRIDVP